LADSPVSAEFFNASMQRAKKHQSPTTGIKKEITMETNNTFECGICYYQSLAKNFAPITVSANFAALECPKCLNNDAESFSEVEAIKKAA
jgi:hypothetical protein